MEDKLPSEQVSADTDLYISSLDPICAIHYASHPMRTT